MSFLNVTARSLIGGATAMGAIGAVDPEPSTKTVLLMAAATTIVTAIVVEVVTRVFRDLFGQ